MSLKRLAVPWTIFSALPRGFQLTISDDAHFNSTVYVELFFIDKKTVLHMVDEATGYQAARWLSSVRAKNIWQALQLCWIDISIGLPEVIAHDSGKNFHAESFK